MESPQAKRPDGSRRLAHVGLALYLLVCVLAIAGPGTWLAGRRVTPWVLGLPFSFAWYAGWAALTFAALAVYHRATDGGRE